MSKHGIVADLLFGAIETTLAPIVAVVVGVTGEVSKEATDGTFRAIVGQGREEIVEGLTGRSK